jgi:hypothetical protein
MVCRQPTTWWVPCNHLSFNNSHRHISDESKPSPTLINGFDTSKWNWIPPRQDKESEEAIESVVPVLKG